jgi:hypothetical protein
VLARLRKKNLDSWLRDYGRHLLRRARLAHDGPIHLLFALCDHYEPLWGGAPETIGRARVDAWAERYAALGSFETAMAARLAMAGSSQVRSIDLIFSTS